MQTNFNMLLLQLLLLLGTLSVLTAGHKSNYAVIVSSSRYWFNYRHVINALSIYTVLRDNGIPDDNIILMLADEIPTNPRNPHKNGMFAEGRDRRSLYNASVEIDYRGDEVTVHNLRRVLLGKGEARVLESDQDSNVLVYWTGHGGDQFFKFQDVEEITSSDIATLLDDMYDARMYKELLFIADTCQAFTLGNDIKAHNVYMVGSALKDENSYAHHSDYDLGLSVIERYTHKLMEFLRGRNLSRITLQQALIDHFDYREQRAHVGSRAVASRRAMWQVPMSDFFANKELAPRATGVNSQPLMNHDDLRLWQSYSLVSPPKQWTGCLVNPKFAGSEYAFSAAVAAFALAVATTAIRWRA